MLREQSSPANLLQSILVGSFMALAALAANIYKPTTRLADLKPKIQLDQQIPKNFAGWSEDLTQIPILPNPQVQAKLDALYSSTLARTYRNKEGQRVMVSIAYGSDQSSEATAVHRPEFCYSAQGFQISNLGEATAIIGKRRLTVQRMLGVMGQRREPITYWITMDETATLPGFSRKYEQIRYGLRGQIPDGLLFRVSSIGSDNAESFKLQNQFLNDLAANMAPSILPRYFGQ
jgi:EpsI family protein